MGQVREATAAYEITFRRHNVTLRIENDQVRGELGGVARWPDDLASAPTVNTNDPCHPRIVRIAMQLGADPDPLADPAPRLRRQFD